MILQRVFGTKKTGFYVDVGAHHPQRYSNTYAFYLKGWRGIAIDPLPNCDQLFEELRPEDIFLNYGVASRSGNVDYFSFAEPAYNTFSQAQAHAVPSKLLKVLEVKVEPLSHILDQHLPLNQDIDFMSVDAEGLDEDVLRSNNWEKYRPHYVIAEIYGAFDMQAIERTSLASFMKSVGYTLFCKTVNSVIFRKAGLK